MLCLPIKRGFFCSLTFYIVHGCAIQRDMIGIPRLEIKLAFFACFIKWDLRSVKSATCGVTYCTSPYAKMLKRT